MSSTRWEETYCWSFLIMRTLKEPVSFKRRIVDWLLKQSISGSYVKHLVLFISSPPRLYQVFFNRKWPLEINVVGSWAELLCAGYVAYGLLDWVWESRTPCVSIPRSPSPHTRSISSLTFSLSVYLAWLHCYLNYRKCQHSSLATPQKRKFRKRVSLEFHFRAKNEEE